MANIKSLKSKYEKAIKKEQSLSSLLLTNLVKYKQAKAKGDEKAIAKFTKIAGQLSPKKKKATEDASKAYKEYEDAISGLHADAELELKEYIREVIFGQLKKKKLTEADIDMGKVFMKGVGPGGEPNPDQLTDEPEKVEKEVEDALKDLEKDFKKADLEPKNVDEALGLTLAGVALSLPAIISLIGKFVNLLKKIPGLKSLSGDRIIALGDKWHHKLMSGITYAIQALGVKDKTKAKKFGNIIFHVVIAILLFAGGAAAYDYATKGSISAATLKGALNAVKAGEIKTFIVKSAETIV
jgi:hypothetical protein